ncbi:MAG: hypothetical protein RI885_907 [Actinomycetota bacterium]|jgi:hypothetical protein
MPTAATLQRLCAFLESSARRVPALQAVARHPTVVLLGYGVATAVGVLWGGALSVGRFERQRGVWVASGCPPWAFGRGGTTLGAVYLTSRNVSPGVLDHEAVHRAQWRRYGLAFVILYLAAGADPLTNRFEVEAGLERGGYR